MKKRYCFGLSLICFAVSFILLVMKVGFPYHRALALGVYAGSLILFVLSVRHTAGAIRDKGRQARGKLNDHRLKVCSMLFFLAGAYVLWVLIPTERSPLLDYTDEALHQEIRNDLDLIFTLDANLRESYAAMQQSGLMQLPIEQISPEINRNIRDAWRRYLDAMFEFDILKEKYKGFAQISYSKKPELHARAFGIAFGSYVAQYRARLYLDGLVADHTDMQSVLNESDPVRGIPAGMYKHLQHRTVHPRTLLRYHAGVAYLGLMEEKLTTDDHIHSQLRLAIYQVNEKLTGEPKRLIEKPLYLLEQSAFEGWLPVQKRIALGMSHIRAKKRPNLIDRQSIARIEARLQPGDIMLQRRNWYATNLGIPGYWPHAALYIGSLGEMDEAFSGIEDLKGITASRFLEQHAPDLYQLLKTPDAEGDSPRVIEAIAPGVVLTTLVQSAGADSLAVLRPQVSIEDKWNAILRALSYYGRPYDYNFDFATDSELVCSELVYKAYADMDGLNLQTVMINGRSLMPPNHLVIKFDREYDNPDRELELVVFLDGQESKGRVVEADAMALRQSWNRPKWYILKN
ncbi:MAG: YiiX/YebB-like N1pC/P60 family cysteine hydrolase [Verrucomicrobiota bacterium]